MHKDKIKHLVMRYLLSIFLTVTGITYCVAACANPPCPQRANRLEDFAVCMRPYPNGMGQQLIGYCAAGMDYHTARVMNSMNYSSTIPPQVYPVVSAVSLISNMAVAMAYVKTNPWGYPSYTYIYPYYYLYHPFPYAYIGIGIGP